MPDPIGVDDVIRRLQTYKDILGVIILNAEGIAIKTTFENEETVQYAALVSHFIVKTRSAIRKLDSDDNVSTVRIRSKKHEIIIAPEFGKNQEYYLVVVHSPSATF